MDTETMMPTGMTTVCVTVGGWYGAGDGRGWLEGDAGDGETPLDDVAMATLHVPPRAVA